MSTYNIHGLSSINTMAFPGTTGLLVNYSTTDPEATLVTLVSSPGLSSWVYAPTQVGSNLVMPAVLNTCGGCPNTGCTPCLAAGAVNVSVWLSASSSMFNGTHHAETNIVVYTSKPCSGFYDRGCLDLTVAPRLFLPDKEDFNVSLPMNVSCTGDFYVGLTLATHTRSCTRQILGPFPCTSPPANFDYFLRGSSQCTFFRSNTSYATFWRAFLWERNIYETYLNATGISIDYYALHARDYSFFVPFPSIKVALASGASAVASLGTTAVKLPPLVLPPGLTGNLYLENAGRKQGTATQIARVEVQLNDGTVFPVANLTVPLTVSFPLVPDRCKLPVCNYWDVKTNEWATQGCETLQDQATNAYICSCTHATDFSMLLLDSQVGDCVEISPSVEPFFMFASVYIAIGLVALYYTCRLIAVCRQKCHVEIILEHLGIVSVATLRAFLSLYQTGVAGSIPTVTIATISTVPRLLEFVMFSFIVTRWGALLHFAMSGPNPFKKVRPFFIAINVFAAAIVLYMFIAFAVAPSYDAAIVGEALSAFNGLFLSVGFLVYACWLHKQFSKMDTRANSKSSPRKKCGPRVLVWVGLVLALSFIAQGVFACLSLSSIPRDLSNVPDLAPIIFDLDLYNGLYRMFNVISLACILVLYHDGIVRITEPKAVGSSHGSTQVSSEKNGRFSV